MRALGWHGDALVVVRYEAETAFVSGLALWLGARFVGSPDLHMVATGLVILPIFGALFVHWSRIRVDARRHLSTVRAFPGTRLVVSLTIENHSRLTAPFLLLEDAVPASLGRPARLVVTGIPPRNNETVSYSVLWWATQLTRIVLESTAADCSATGRSASVQ